MKPILTFSLWMIASGLLLAQPDFYATDQVQDIRIEFAAEDWRYQLDSLRYNGDELLAATVTVNGEQLTNAGARYRNGLSFVPNGKRNGLFIDLGKNRYAGQRTLDLSSALRDPSLVREVVAAEIANRYFATPRANYANVYINNELYGLFVNRESVDGAYLRRAYGNDSGELYYAKARATGSVDEGCLEKSYGSLRYESDVDCYAHNFELVRGDDWTPLHSLSHHLRDNPGDLQSVLDVDATLWMLAFNNLLVNLDSYTGQYTSNYSLYHDGTRLQPILGDLNLAFGSFKNTGVGSDLAMGALLQLSPLLHADAVNKPLVSALLSDPSMRKRYLSHLRTMLYEEFLSGRFTERVTALQTMLQPILSEDENAYYTAEEFAKSTTETIGRRSKIPGLVAFMQKRAAWLKEQPMIAVLPPAFGTPEVAKRPKFSRDRLEEFRITVQVDNYPKEVAIHYRLGDQSMASAEMFDDGAHHDGEAGDGIYGVAIRPDSSEEITYYLVAETAKSAGFSPKDYRYTHHTSSLAEINQ